MKKQLLILALITASFNAYAQYEYNIWFPEGASVTEIPKIHLWMFENQNKFDQMLRKVTGESFTEGFERGYGMVNKATVQYLPKAGKLAEPVVKALTGVAVPIGTMAEIGAKVHTATGKVLAEVSKKIEREVIQKEKKRLRIGYVGAFKPENQYYVKEEPKLRKIYLVLTLPKDVAKNVQGPAKDTDYYPLLQGNLELPEGKDKGYWKLGVRKNIVNGVPWYSAQLIEIPENEFPQAQLRRVRD